MNALALAGLLAVAPCRADTSGQSALDWLREAVTAGRVELELAVGSGVLDERELFSDPKAYGPWT